MDLKEEIAVGGDPSSHWYYISKGQAIKAMLGDASIRRLLDIGAGSGVFAKMLVNGGLADSAVCVDPNYEDEFLGARHTDKISFLRSAPEVDADAVLMIDVIEHVNDDVALIRDYADRADPGARFLISVPAFQFLWSGHDEFLEHRRRYTLGSLRGAVTAAGLEPVRTRYFFGFIFPAVAALRTASRALRKSDAPAASQLNHVPDWLNGTLVALHEIERLALLPVNRLAGVTAFCLARKPALASDREAA